MTSPETITDGNVADGVQVSINGRPQSVPRGLTVAGLLRHLGIEADRVAIELNRDIVRRPAWDSTPIEDKAELEIVHFVGGG